MSPRTTMKAAFALLLAASTTAHINLAVPVPFNYQQAVEDKGPITSAQYPCKHATTVTTMNNMKVGEEQLLAFNGSAVHGGGSCQLSITTDKVPTVNSKFKVIQSIEGGCPGTTDTTNQYKFKLPDSVPNGQVTFAWTWFDRLAGQPEMYMNCAPIMVTGGASDSSKLDLLPDILVANIGQGCTTPQNFNTQFPNPGDNLIKDDSAAVAKLPTGNCGSSGTGGGSSSAAASGVASTAAPASSAAASSVAAVSSNTGGVFAPSAPSAAGTSTMTTLVTVTGSPSQPAQATSAAGTAPIAATSASGASPSGVTGGSTCTTNGAIVCNGPTQFGLCDNGNVVWQAVAAGTTCSNGAIQKRSYVRQFNGRIPRPRMVVPGQDFTPDN